MRNFRLVPRNNKTKSPLPPKNTHTRKAETCTKKEALAHLDLLRLSLSSLHALRSLAVKHDLTLLKVAAGVLVDQDEREIVASRVFLVDFAEGWGEVEAAEEEADRDCFATGRRAVHDLWRG